MSFPTYPAYKDSGVEWLGAIPAHWSVIPLARIASKPGSLFIDGDWVESKDLADDGIRYITTGNVGEGKYKEQGSGYISQDKFDELRCTEVLPGDVLISRLNLPIGRACVVPDLGERIITSVDNVITRPDDGYSRSYLAYMLSSASHFANMEILARGTTMQRISRSTLGQVRFAFPSFDEQTTIAGFLDRETAKIDALVAEQEQLITLLKEKRQAVISHTVTKGLDPSVPMKDSGVDWLGEVPAHWAIAALNYRYEVLLGKMLDEKKISGNHLAPYLRNVDVQWDRINIDELPQMDFDGSDVERYGLRAGDLLVCEGGDVGRAAIWQGELTECYYQKALHRLRPRDGSSDLPRFQFYLMQAAAKLEVFTGGQGKATIAHLTAEALRRYRFAYPTRTEQEQIVEYLDEAVGQFDELILEAASASQLLQERRSVLISAAVTGQIDVRAH